MPLPASNNSFCTSAANMPIGVYDSGIGGLSILRPLMQAMPHRQFIYMADTAYAPYGERTDAYILERSRVVARWMHDVHRTCGLVIACNTATAAAGKTLRTEYDASWPIIGVEPGIKPAALLSKTGRIAIMATASALHSSKFQALMQNVQNTHTQIPLQFFLCPCEGLAKAIEFQRDAEIDALIARYTQTLVAPDPDVLVLGCTHYPLVADRITQALPQARILDTGEAVARHVKDIFSSPNTPHADASIPRLSAWTNANPQQLQAAIDRWLPDLATQVQVQHTDCS